MFLKLWKRQRTVAGRTAQETLSKQGSQYTTPCANHSSS